MGFLRPEIEIFAEKMETVMKLHDAKKGDSYKTCDFDYLIGKLEEEYLEISDSLGGGLNKEDKAEIQGAVKECIDVANLCMMISWRLLEGD
jgi:hypothetical protein